MRSHVNIGFQNVDFFVNNIKDNMCRKEYEENMTKNQYKHYQNKIGGHAYGYGSITG